ncbi:RICIN domain-containing protein [Kitasatospora sp. MAP5-34]|uniref:RICIN domain-containing protein n=1 Tax=Kitasatospora sp. MAP5-34 TaxID=3035102 RepID=UPI0024747E3D|nr:RICIN domain-containing protein [Kitasatospora sp. MAP5-34]
MRARRRRGRNQHWLITPAPTGGYTLTSAHSGLPLTTSGEGDGSGLAQQAATGATTQG